MAENIHRLHCVTYNCLGFELWRKLTMTTNLAYLDPKE